MTRYSVSGSLAIVGLLGLMAAELLVTSVATADNAAGDATYIGFNQCQVCHQHQNAVWKDKMGHSKAFEVLKSDEAKAVAERVGLATPPHESPECLRCHVTAYDVEKKAPVAPIKMEQGVQCESCHGPSSEHLKVGRMVKFNQAKLEDVDIMAGRAWPGESNCRECHNKESATWREDRYTLEDGTMTGFDFEQAMAKINHANPEKE